MYCYLSCLPVVTLVERMVKNKNSKNIVKFDKSYGKTDFHTYVPIYRILVFRRQVNTNYIKKEITFKSKSLEVYTIFSSFFQELRFFPLPGKFPMNSWSVISTLPISYFFGKRQLLYEIFLLPREIS